VAKEAGIKSMAMPAIGTGVFKFPPELAAEIIINGLVTRMADFPEIELVRICVGTQDMKAVFVSTLAAKTSSPA
jgi:O-acetyl-ADP-ribose deacetylase (regulator of RNase III)